MVISTYSDHKRGFAAKGKSEALRLKWLCMGVCTVLCVQPEDTCNPPGSCYGQVFEWRIPDLFCDFTNCFQSPEVTSWLYSTVMLPVNHPHSQLNDYFCYLLNCWCRGCTPVLRGCWSWRNPVLKRNKNGTLVQMPVILLTAFGAVGLSGP